MAFIIFLAVEPTSRSRSAALTGDEWAVRKFAFKFVVTFCFCGELPLRIFAHRIIGAKGINLKPVVNEVISDAVKVAIGRIDTRPCRI